MVQAPKGTSTIENDKADCVLLHQQDTKKEAQHPVKIPDSDPYTSSTRPQGQDKSTQQPKTAQNITPKPPITSGGRKFCRTCISCVSGGLGVRGSEFSVAWPAEEFTRCFKHILLFCSHGGLKILRSPETHLVEESMGGGVCTSMLAYVPDANFRPGAVNPRTAYENPKPLRP